MERIHPAPAQTVLQGKARIFLKFSVEEISRAIGQFAPDYCGDCVNDEPQALFDNIRRFVSIAVVRVGPGLAHGALHQTLPSTCQGICSSKWWQVLYFNRRWPLTVPPLRCADGTPIPRKWPAVASSRRGLHSSDSRLEPISVSPWRVSGRVKAASHLPPPSPRLAVALCIGFVLLAVGGFYLFNWVLVAWLERRAQRDRDPRQRLFDG